MVREGINRYSDDELSTNRVAVGDQPVMFRYWCSILGSTGGAGVFLYDKDGEGVCDENHLENAINKFRSLYEEQEKINPYADKEVWVIPADVHY